MAKTKIYQVNMIVKRVSMVKIVKMVEMVKIVKMVIWSKWPKTIDNLLYIRFDPYQPLTFVSYRRRRWRRR